jgi:caffeoyl-CoA O-methyltransferase
MSRDAPPWLDPAVAAYAAEHTTATGSLERALIEETAALGRQATMQISPTQGVLMGILARATGARRAIEVGTFTGYSALCVARALPDDGTLLCCDVNEEWTAIARRYWEQAGVAAKIELRLAPALDTLRSLPQEESYDFAFIDADKGNYGRYYDEIVPRLRPGGLVLVDNTLWSGRVMDEKDEDPDTVAIRAFNDKVWADDRMVSVLLPISDGLTVLLKR